MVCRVVVEGGSMYIQALRFSFVNGKNETLFFGFTFFCLKQKDKSQTLI